MVNYTGLLGWAKSSGKFFNLIVIGICTHIEALGIYVY